ncbi:MAG: type II secretion system protein [Candidatus Riflebacteria bacterium]|nr:type II secretion system protein [Candidatus Riflebacteria bacterium]
MFFNCVFCPKKETSIGKRASSLIEILVAFAILAFLLLPMFNILADFSSGTRQQKMEGVAVNLAKEEMNWWMYVASPSYFDSRDLTNWNSRQGVIEIEGNQFSLDMKVRKIPLENISFKYPVFDFHNPCQGGAESHIISIGSGVTRHSKILSQIISPVSAKKYLFYDFLLRVRWRAPNDLSFTSSAFPKAKERFIVSRRAIYP